MLDKKNFVVDNVFVNDKVSGQYRHRVHKWFWVLDFLSLKEKFMIHEECGVFGVYAKQPMDVAKTAYYGLYALQHRGQESCGIVVNQDGLFYSKKDLGLVSDVFHQEDLASLPQGKMAHRQLCGHVWR